jgi:hypothetical protein
MSQTYQTNAHKLNIIGMNASKPFKQFVKPGATNKCKEAIPAIR